MFFFLAGRLFEVRLPTGGGRGGAILYVWSIARSSSDRRPAVSGVDESFPVAGRSSVRIQRTDRTLMALLVRSFSYNERSSVRVWLSDHPLVARVILLLVLPVGCTCEAFFVFGRSSVGGAG